MKLVDANVLLCAVDADAEHHAESRRWLDGALAGGDTVGFAWVVLLAFTRLSTKAGLYPNPLTVEEALTQVDEWVNAPGGCVASPGEGHLRVLAGILSQVGSGGNLVNDAHLAALAVEHRATVVTYDTDFARFDAVRWRRPDQLLS